MQATAIIVGEIGRSGARLWNLAEQIGFTAVLPYTGLPAAERQCATTPLLFFLFDAVTDISTLRPTAEAIRFSGSRSLRFSPMVYLDASPSLDAIRRCIDMGFDDVVTAPFSATRVGNRLRRLVGHPHVYFESAGYVGPDRKINLTAEPGDGKYRRLEILRSAAGGVSIVSDELQVLL